MPLSRVALSSPRGGVIRGTCHDARCLFGWYRVGPARLLRASASFRFAPGRFVASSAHVPAWAALANDQGSPAAERRGDTRRARQSAPLWAAVRACSESTDRKMRNALVGTLSAVYESELRERRFFQR